MHNFPNRFSLRSLSRTRCSRHGAIAHLSLPSLLLARGRHHPFDEQSMHKNGAKNFFTFPMCLAANYTRAGFRQTARARVSPSFLVCAEKRPLAKDSVVSPRLPRRGLVQGTSFFAPTRRSELCCWLRQSWLLVLSVCLCESQRTSH